MTETFPPPDYIQTESAVSGIIVYMPRPPQEEDEVVDFICPNCTAATAYSTDDGGLTCTACGYHEVPQAEQVGRGAEEFEFTVDTVTRSANGWGTERKELVCNSCAAHTTLPVAMLTHTCPFCASNSVVQMKAAQDALRPRFLVPFDVTTDQCREKTAVWLSESWMLPDGLQTLGRSTEYVPIYVPFWTFDARAFADWKAEVAHRRTRKGKTQTVWKWEKGKVQLYFDDVLVYGTSKISRNLLNQIRTFDLQQLVAYEASFLAGMQAQAYDVQLEPAFAEARRRMRDRTQQECKTQATSSRMRNFSMNLDFQDESWRYILLPLYLAVYRYGDKSYQVLINGQTGEIAGQRPADWRKILKRLGLVALPALLLIIASIVVNSQGGQAEWLFILAMLAVLVTIIYVVTTVVAAVRLDNE